MTKSYGATKGNLRLAARYYGTIAYEEEYGEFAEETDAIQSAQSLEELEEVLADADPKYKEYMKPWYNKADKLAKAFDNDGVLDPEAYPEDERRIIELANTLEGDEKTGAKIVLKALEAPLYYIAANAGLEGSVIINKVQMLSLLCGIRKREQWKHNVQWHKQKQKDY